MGSLNTLNPFSKMVYVLMYYCMSMSIKIPTFSSVVIQAVEEDPAKPFRERPLCVYSGHQADVLDLSWSKVIGCNWCIILLVVLL